MYQYFRLKGYDRELSRWLEVFCKERGWEGSEIPPISFITDNLENLRDRVDRANIKSGRGQKEGDIWRSKEL